MSETMVLSPQRRNARFLIHQDGQWKIQPVLSSMRLGRNTGSSSVDIPFAKPYVSRNQGLIRVLANGYEYIDQSSYGTWINGRRMSKNQSVMLKNGDVLQIFNTLDKSKREVITLVFETNYEQGELDTRQIALNSSIDQIRIGRKNLNNNRYISQNHAVFRQSGNGWVIEDLNSLNGVYLNNLRIMGARTLKNGDVIRIGNVHFAFNDRMISYMEFSESHIRRNMGHVEVLQIDIVERTARNLTSKVTLLKDIHLSIEQGQMVLVLGGSGAGKTTLMNAIMGYEKAKGKVRYGQRDIYKDYRHLKHEIGFVPQQDLLRMNDTVYGTLSNAARMKIRKQLTPMQIEQRIDEVLKRLGLMREKNSLVGKLSGGQRKRLSIAVEYISDPNLFFLDEPDSGLDGVMARELMENLRGIANEGKVVMVISHAPDRVSDLYDKVVVLAKSEKDNVGHLAFYGGIQEAKHFFGTNQLEEIVKKINRKDEGGLGLSDFYIEKYARQAQNH